MGDINQTLDKAIQEKDLELIRNILTTGMVQDPGFNSGVFEERLKKCLAAGLSEIDIYVPFQGEPFNNDPSVWTVDYFARQQTKFRYNFSRERLEHLKKVGKKLFPATAPSWNEEGDKKKYEGGYQSGQTSGRKEGGIPKWVIPAGIGAIILLWLLFGRK